MSIPQQHPSRNNGQTFYKLVYLLGIACLSACGPIGQVKRTIHALPQPSANKQANQDSGGDGYPSLRAKPGLPTQCTLEARDTENFCIICKERSNDIERCYLFRGVLDTNKSCVYTSEAIKCLQTKPTFALSLGLKGSLEKALFENTKTWEEGLRLVALPHLDPEAKVELNQALQLTEQLMQSIIKAKKNPGWVDSEWSGTWARLEGSAPRIDELKKNLLRLQHDKETGQLTLKQLIEFSRSLLEATGTSASVLSYWNALSIEGLEEPN